MKVGFKSTRYYWSYRQINKRCRYVCKIEDQNGRPQFVVTVLEKGMDQVILKNSSCKGMHGFFKITGHQLNTIFGENSVG